MPTPIEAFLQAEKQREQKILAALDDIVAAVDGLRSIIGTQTRARVRTAVRSPQEATGRRRGRAKASASTNGRGARGASSTSANGRRKRGIAAGAPRRRKTAKTSENGLIVVDVGKAVMDHIISDHNANLNEPIKNMTETRRGRGVSCRLTLTPDQALSLKGELDIVAKDNPPLKPAIRRVLEALGS